MRLGTRLGRWWLPVAILALVVPGSAPAGAVDLDFDDGFEAGLGGWTATHDADKANTDWALKVQAHSGTSAVRAFAPPVSADLYLTLKAAVPVVAGAQLSFWTKREMGSGDFGLVEVSVDGGATWTNLTKEDWVQNGYQTINDGSDLTPGGWAFGGVVDTYQQSVASLSRFAGQTVRLRFRLWVGDDGSSSPGWFVDDVHVDGPPAPASVPGAPAVTGVKPRGTKVKVSFGAAADGGSPVTSYTVECSGKHGAKTRSATGATSPVKVKKLTRGKKYTCRVRATNAVGTGQFGAASKKFKVPPAKH
jgi:hypothetical protein